MKHIRLLSICCLLGAYATPLVGKPAKQAAEQVEKTSKETAEKAATTPGRPAPKPPPLRGEQEVLEAVEEAIQERMFTELRERIGLGNLRDTQHILSYFTALGAHETRKEFEGLKGRIVKKALVDSKLYIYLERRQIKNMVRGMLADFAERAAATLRKKERK